MSGFQIKFDEHFGKQISCTCIKLQYRLSLPVIILCLQKQQAILRDFYQTCINKVCSPNTLFNIACDIPDFAWFCHKT